VGDNLSLSIDSSRSQEDTKIRGVKEIT